MIPDRAPSQEFEPADGVMTEFSLDIAAPEPENIHVAINGVELTSGFTVSSATTGSSFVKFDTPPESGAVVSAWRLTPMTQERAFGTGSAFYPKQVEKALDRVTAIVQEIRGGTTATAAVPVADYAHSATVAARADYTAYAADAGHAAEADGASSAASAGFAYSAGGLTAGAMEEVVSAVAGAVTISSAAEAGVASGLTSAAMTAVVNSAAAAVTVTSVAEAGVASGLTNGAKADIVSSAAAAVVVPDAGYKGPFKVEFVSSSSEGYTFRVYDGTATDYANATYAGRIRHGRSGKGGQLVNKSSFVVPASDNSRNTICLWAFTKNSSSSDGASIAIGTTSMCSAALISAGGSVNDQICEVDLASFGPYRNGTREISQRQLGDIALPGLLPKASGGLHVTSQGVIVLDSATDATSGGVLKVTSIGMNTDSSAVPTVGAVKDYVAASGGSGGTIIYSGGTADYASSAGGLTSAAKTAIVNSAAAAVTSVSEAGVASSLTAAAKADIIASAGSGGSVSVSATYGGPFAVTASGSAITVAGGRVYLGGAEYATTSATLASSNGTVYYYMYYSGGSYYSGCSLAASASALAAVIRGSQGYYTALANVQGGSVTQCHYGDIRIDGRVS